MSVSRGTVWVGTKVYFHDNSVLEILPPWKIVRKETGLGAAGDLPSAAQPLSHEFHFSLPLGTGT